MSAAADKAVRHVLSRMLQDPRLGFLLGFGSESFDLLTAAQAEAEGRPVELLRSTLMVQLARRAWSGEMLDWHDAKLTKPDAELTVVCIDAEDVWCGYWDGESWIGCESGGTVAAPRYWADPKGPQA
ncbi:MAG TPA: hypothetical protein VGE36_04495 [Roseateles sp.]